MQSLPLECDEHSLLVVGELLRPAKHQTAVADSNDQFLPRFLPEKVLLTLHSGAYSNNALVSSISAESQLNNDNPVPKRAADAAGNLAFQNSTNALGDPMQKRVPFESMRIRAVTEKLRARTSRKQLDATLMREVSSTVKTGAANSNENVQANEDNGYVKVEPASPAECDPLIAKQTDKHRQTCGTLERTRPLCGLLPKRIRNELPEMSCIATSDQKLTGRLVSSGLPNELVVDETSEADMDAPIYSTAAAVEVERENSYSSLGLPSGESNSRQRTPKGKVQRPPSRVSKSKVTGAKEETDEQQMDVGILAAPRPSSSRSAKYASNADAKWRVLQADEVDANAVSRTRLKQLVRELVAEYTQGQTLASRPSGSRLFVKRISELMRQRHRILILEGSVRTLIMQADLVRLRSGEYLPFDGDSDVQALRTRLGEVGCAAMLRERTQRSQVESVLSELAASNRVVRTRELMRTCRARFRLPRDRYFYNHVAHKLGFVYNWNLQSWVRRGDDVSDLVGRLAKLKEEIKGVAKVFATRGGELANEEPDSDDDDLKPSMLVSDDQHVEMAVRHVASSILDKVHALRSSITGEELRSALYAHQVDAEIVQNDEFLQFVFEEAGFMYSSSSGKFEPQHPPPRAGTAPKWFRCWLMNKILKRLFTADILRQSVHYYELQAEALKAGVQLRLVRQVFLMYALDDYYMVEHRWVPIDDRFARLLNVTRDTLAELRARHVQVTKAVLLAELDRRGVRPQERGLPKLIERIGYTFSYLDHSYVPADSKLKMK